jgi:hypothetical protein
MRFLRVSRETSPESPLLLTQPARSISRMKSTAIHNKCDDLEGPGFGEMMVQYLAEGLSVKKGVR